MKSRKALLATMPFAAVVTSGAFAAPIPCEGLASLHLPDTTISVAASVPAGAFTPPGATAPIDTAACRVAGIIKPTSDSSIVFEVWMPTNGWNGKFLQVGNGAWGGSIQYGALGDALRRGDGRSLHVGVPGGVPADGIQCRERRRLRGGDRCAPRPAGRQDRVGDPGR
jgi:feruloyl esterase